MGDIRHRLRQITRILWRGKHLIIACVLLGLAPTALYLAQVTPQYTAEVKVMIEGAEASEMVTLDHGGSALRQRPTDGVVQTETEVLTSNLLMRRVVDKLNLASDPEFNAKLREPKAFQVMLRWLNPLSWLPDTSQSDDAAGKDKISPKGLADIAEARIVDAARARLKVQSQRHSFIISATFNSEGREKAALIANTLAELYVNDRLEASFDDARRVTAWLGERLEGLRRDVATAEAAAEQYRSTYNLRRKTGDNKQQGTVADQQLSELNSRLIIARTELAQKQARLDQVRSLLRSHGSDTSSDVLQSQLIQHLREQETVLLRSISESGKIYGDRHPKIVGERADLVELQAKINAEIEKIGTSVANDVEVSATGVHTLEAELAGLSHESNVAGANEVKLRELERQAEVSRGLYESFLSRFKRDTDQEQVQRANARIISPATVPVSRSTPRRAATMTMAFMMSFGFGVLLVLVLDRMDNAVRSADEAEELSGLPMLAVIPVHRGDTANTPKELADNPRSPLADAIRSLRVTLDLGEGEGKARVIMVTSSMPKEGKTFASLCLATMLSRVEARVLLIDGDLHRPKLHAAFGVTGETGLAQVLAGQASIEDVLIRNAADGLDFMPAGLLSKVADLVNEPQVEALLHSLAQYYDRIVVDLPPVLAVADPRIFSRFADRVLYLIKWNSTPRDAVRNGLKLLGDANVTVHGVVLSQVDQKKYSRYAYGDYGNYYGRYKEYYQS